MMSFGDLVGEVRRAVRRLRSAPGVSLAAIACLSIGVWMACVVEAVGHGFFRPNLHVPQPERLVQLEERGLFSTDPQLTSYTTSRSVMDSLARNRSFASVGYYYWRYAVALEGDAETHNAVYLSSGMMGVLGARPAAASSCPATTRLVMPPYSPGSSGSRHTAVTRA